MTSDTRDEAAWRLRVYPTAILLTLIAALVLATAVYDPDDATSRLGGDYPAFYGAGSIIAHGDWDDLYSASRQQEEQAGLINDDGGYLYFSYPPFVAGVYGVLAIPSYQWSFLLHAALMGVALAAAIWVLRPWLEKLSIPTVALLVLALAFYPVFRAVVGGQNTTLSLLLFAGAARLDHEDRPLAAGLLAAGLLFKPQYAVVIVPLLVVGRRWRALAGWGVGAVGLYAISTVLMGGAWLANWWSQAGSFRDLNAAANGANFVSIPGFVANLIDSDGAAVVGYGVAVLLGAIVAFIWWRDPVGLPLLRWSLAAAAAAVVAPQTLYYDAGLLLLGLVAVLPRFGPRVLAAVTAGVVLSWLQLAASALEWSPLGPLSWAAFLAMLLLGWRNFAATD